MKKNVLFLIVVICVSFFSQKVLAQGGNYIDVVYLKNGSVIKGIIVEQVPNQSIKIQTADGSLFVYKISEVEKMTKEQTGRIISNNRLSNNSNNNTENQNQTSNSDTEGQPTILEDIPNGFEQVVEFGYAPASESMDYLKLNCINGYRFNPYFSAGIGTGLRYYTTADALCFPLFVDFRTNILKVLKSQFSPYVAFGIGYTFEITPDFQGLGVFINPNFGVLYHMNKKTSLHFGIGIESQRFSQSSMSLSPVCINLGVSY